MYQRYPQPQCERMECHQVGWDMLVESSVGWLICMTNKPLQELGFVCSIHALMPEVTMSKQYLSSY